MVYRSRALDNICSCGRECLSQGHVPCRSDAFAQNPDNIYRATRPCRRSLIQTGDPDHLLATDPDADAELNSDTDDFDGVSDFARRSYVLGYDLLSDAIGSLSRTGRQ